MRKDDLAKRADANRAKEKAEAERLIALREAELAALEDEGKADGVLATQLGEALYDYERRAYWSCIGQISDEGIRFARTLS